MAPIIHFDYDFSPYGQKTKSILAAAGVPFQKCDQPVVLPRPDLEAMGITYRRIPLLAVGKDIYCDTALIIPTIVSLGKLPTSPADRAFHDWGDKVFSEVLAIIPQAMLTEGFVNDRAAIFPFLTRPDLATLRPSAVAQLRQRLAEVEHEFLGSGSGPFMNGSQISLADLHIGWVLRWVFGNLGVGEQDGCGKAQFPKVYKFVEALPEAKPEVLSAEKTQATIKGAEYTAKALDVAKDDPLGIPAGTMVNITSFDADPGKYPQAGKLIGTSINETVVEIKDGVRLHFPRIGYIVKAQ